MTKVYCKDCRWIGDKPPYGIRHEQDIKCMCPEHQEETETWYEKVIKHPLCSVQNMDNNCTTFNPNDDVTYTAPLKCESKVEETVSETVSKPDDTLYDVIACDWTEYERGWGQRPDGTTLHLNMEEYTKYIKEHERLEKLRYKGVVPDEYTSPDGPRTVKVSATIYKRCQLEKSFWIQLTGWWRDEGKK